MLNRVREFIITHKLISPGDFIIAGISGGPDSMALLYIMKNLCKELDFKVAVAHLNHGLRPEAAAEEKLVKNYCTQWDIEFHSRTLDIKAIARQGKKSLEEAGRDCRYQFFNELLGQLGAGKIATAHHQDDMAETVLLHLLRGSGIKGLRGIMPVKGNLIRPLLCVCKNEIKTFLHQKRVDYYIDRSNYELSYLRNRIRHRLIPMLQKDYNPQIIENLNRLADIAREDNDALEEETRRWWEKLLIKINQDEIVFDKQKLLEMHPAFQRRLILEAFSRLKGESGWDRADVQKVIELAQKEGSSKYVILKKGLRVKVVYRQLHFVRQLVPTVSFKCEIKVPGRVEIPASDEVYVFELCQRADLEHGNGDILLDYDKLKTPLFIRSRRPGDRFKPLGGRGSKKLKDYFIDLKIPLSERDKIPLLASEGDIYAILGLRLSSLAAVGPDSERILLIRKEE